MGWNERFVPEENPVMEITTSGRGVVVSDHTRTIISERIWEKEHRPQPTRTQRRQIKPAR